MTNFRPSKLSELVGQEKVREQLGISIEAALGRNEKLNHCMMTGGAGIGKTTLAHCIANEMGSDIIIANGATLRSPKAILPYIFKAEGKILFIDEIHRLTTIVSELLYPVLEDFRLDFQTKDDKLNVELEPFTVVAATTEAGKLPKPFYDRFPLKYQLSLYTESELCQLINSAAQKLQLTITDDAASLVSQVSRGTPRIALARLDWIRDFIYPSQAISKNDVEKGLALADIHLDGTTPQDRQYLDAIRKYRGEPVGLKTIVAETGLAPQTVLEQIEPFLLRNNFVKRTPKGRVLA